VKVLFVCSANRNGIGSIVKLQGDSLNQHGIEVDYYGNKGRGLRGYLSNVSSLRSYVLKSKPDLIHAHYSLSAIVAGLTLTRKPLIVSLMGSDIKMAIYFRWIIRLFSKAFWDKVIVKSQFMMNDILIRQAAIIPNGVDLSRFKPLDKKSLKKKFSFSEDKSVVLFLADPSRESKYFYLAKRAYQLIDPVKAELQVRFNIPPDKIPLIINAADVILLTSIWEGSPNVVKEAMACNCPVVATDVGDVVWLFGDEAGYFLTGFEPEDVAEKITAAVQFVKERGRTNGRQRIIDLGLDSEAVARRLIGIYEEVLGQRLKTEG
jgi:glycosyltransferase involved in cell wall biosynthesis